MNGNPCPAALLGGLSECLEVGGTPSAPITNKVTGFQAASRALQGIVCTGYKVPSLCEQKTAQQLYKAVKATSESLN